MIDWIVDKTFAPGMVVGMISPIIALVVVGTLYARRRPAVHPFLYWFAALAAGIVVGFLGMIKGVEMACPKAGNLCGLFGFFVTGPISFALAMMAVAILLCFANRAPCAR